MFVDQFERVVLFQKFIKGGEVEERVFTYFLVHLCFKNNKLMQLSQVQISLRAGQIFEGVIDRQEVTEADVNIGY